MEALTQKFKVSCDHGIGELKGSSKSTFSPGDATKEGFKAQKF